MGYASLTRLAKLAFHLQRTLQRPFSKLECSKPHSQAYRLAAFFLQRTLHYFSEARVPETWSALGTLTLTATLALAAPPAAPWRGRLPFGDCLLDLGGLLRNRCPACPFG